MLLSLLPYIVTRFLLNENSFIVAFGLLPGESLSCRSVVGCIFLLRVQPSGCRDHCGAELLPRADFRTMFCHGGPGMLREHALLPVCMEVGRRNVGLFFCVCGTERDWQSIEG